MSSRREVGQEDVRSDGSDQQHDDEAGEEFPEALDDCLPEIDSITNWFENEDTIAALVEEDTTQQNSEPRSVDSSRALQNQTANEQLLQHSADADETSSVPDDTPSIQVPFALLTLRAHVHTVRIPLSLRFIAMYTRFAPKSQALALPLLAGPSTNVSSLVCRLPP